MKKTSKPGSESSIMESAIFNASLIDIRFEFELLRIFSSNSKTDEYV